MSSRFSVAHRVPSKQRWQLQSCPRNRLSSVDSLIPNVIAGQRQSLETRANSVEVRLKAISKNRVRQPRFAAKTASVPRITDCRLSELL